MSDKVVMVVDDEREFADSLSSFLMKEGYEVITAYSAKEALDALEKNKPGLGVQKNRIGCIVLDIKMPEMDGLQFLEKIRKDYQERIGVIILSAYEDEEKWERAMQGMVAGYLTKPYEKGMLTAFLHLFFNGEESFLVHEANLALYEKKWFTDVIRKAKEMNKKWEEEEDPDTIRKAKELNKKWEEEDRKRAERN